MLPVQDIGVSWPVVWYVVAIMTMSAVLFGLAPALWTSRRIPGDVLKDGGRGSGLSRRARNWRRGLVVCEIALALVLTLGAGLLVRSYQQLQRVDPGFNPDGVLALSVNIPGARYDSAAKISGFYNELLRRVKALPDVESAAVVSSLPLTGGVGWTSDFSVQGHAPDQYGTDVAHRAMSPDYLRTMQVRLKAGRMFTDNDDLHAPQVVVINEALARSYFRNQDPIGQRISFDRTPDSNSTWRTIVGVVADERQAALATDSKIEMIAPERQYPSTFMNVVVRTRHDPMKLVPSIRRVVKELDPLIAFTSVQSMDDVRAQSLAAARFLMILLFAFAVAGMLLAAIGVYGVMAHQAASRTREMGIRIALGARASSVQWLVIREGLQLAGIGLAIGAGVSVIANRAMLGLLFRVTPTDPVTFAVVPGTLLLIAVAAAWIPAARASRADPASSLRIE
jgi:putative ABC transport system permease protein